jgi:hypothetical protein
MRDPFTALKFLVLFFYVGFTAYEVSDALPGRLHAFARQTTADNTYKLVFKLLAGKHSFSRQNSEVHFEDTLTVLLLLACLS